MSSMDPSKLSVIAKRLFANIEFDEDEQLICEIRKHNFGLIMIYISGFTVSAVLFVMLVLGSLLVNEDASIMETDVSGVRMLMVIFGVILTLLSIGMTLLGAYLYKGNVMLVTSEKIAQVLVKTIFHRKISQLSIGDIQDVTVTQKGVLAHYFDYGTLVIETAGEQQNYTFTFTPKPYYYSKSIVGAHEENLKKYGN